jgi:hypothetical protein
VNTAVGALSETVRSKPEVGRLTFDGINDAARRFQMDVL